MKQIDIFPRTLHFRQPAGTSRGVYLTRRIHLLRLSDSDVPSVCGWGECAPLPDLSCDARPDYDKVLREACRRAEREGLTPALCDDLRTLPSVLFGLETAFTQWERGGDKALFDTPFARGEVGIPINGLVWMGSFDEMMQRLTAKLDAGFRCVKLKIGAIDFSDELSLIRAVRRRFSAEQVELRLDANGAFPPDRAAHYLERLAPYHIHSIEQPIRQHQWQHMAQLCRQSPIPIALDEELIGVSSRQQKADLLDEIRPQYIVLKPSLHGAMSGCDEWISLARERNIGCWITSALESNVGLNAIAHYTARTFGPHITFPQGLGTGSLFTDNVPMPIYVKEDRLWYSKIS